MAPLPEDSLVFPAGANRQESQNDYAAGTLFGSIIVSGGDYRFLGGISSSGNIEIPDGTLTATSLVCDSLIIGSVSGLSNADPGGSDEAKEPSLTAHSATFVRPSKDASLVVPEAAAVIFNREEATFDSKDRLREMAQYFFDDADNLFPKMHAASEKVDLEVGRLGHRLKGPTVYLDTEPSKQVALRMEQFYESRGGIGKVLEGVTAGGVKRKTVSPGDVPFAKIKRPPLAAPQATPASYGRMGWYLAVAKSPYDAPVRPVQPFPAEGLPEYRLLVRPCAG